MTSLFVGSAGSSSEGRSASGGRSSRQRRPIDAGYHSNQPKVPDASYADPLGPAVERPKTAARNRATDYDEFDDIEIDDSLLPD